MLDNIYNEVLGERLTQSTAAALGSGSLCFVIDQLILRPFIQFKTSNSECAKVPNCSD